MTEQEYNKRFNELVDEIKQLQSYYISTHELKAGDDVLVVYGGSEKKGQVRAITSNWRYEDIDITVGAYKTDGTLGKNNISTGWGAKIVKLIESPF